ncbi:hypothetical protein CO123_02195 [bacterium (Candidatus Howlettbacteria) CG_4_9_14_3_um_filter_37_10]|nr:MAG: hypothetical protein COX25_02100 [bacterium (Candidatus Howlettbacteria) CG23_combo_of_CG06-09_8_20_14_all_37_9]PJB06421.1 MAG: hypothetical protein CO123_02195 [bacterium (Candidatus Howlettbacteria) CG_4_9_14_3_um_filter_37_10]
MKNNEKNQGFVLIWVLLFSGLLVAATVSLALMTTRELRISSTFDESGRAYSAAEAGMERAFFDLKAAFDTDITSCPNMADTLNVTTDLFYTYFITTDQCGTPNQKFIIESTGSSNLSSSPSTRRLKSIVNLGSLNNIQSFDNIANGATSYPIALHGINAASPLIVMQFDLHWDGANIDDTKVSLYKDNANFYGVRLRKFGDLELTIAGKANGSSITSPDSSTIDFPGDPKDAYYRVRIEVSRPGSNSDYTTVRAVVLKRNVLNNQQNYACIDIDTNNSYTVVGSATQRGTDPDKVMFDGANGRIDGPNVPTPPAVALVKDGLMSIGGGSYIDNVALWTRE